MVRKKHIVALQFTMIPDFLAGLKEDVNTTGPKGACQRTCFDRGKGKAKNHGNPNRRNFSRYVDDTITKD